MKTYISNKDKYNEINLDNNYIQNNNMTYNQEYNEEKFPNNFINLKSENIKYFMNENGYPQLINNYNGNNKIVGYIVRDNINNINILTDINGKIIKKNKYGDYFLAEKHIFISGFDVQNPELRINKDDDEDIKESSRIYKNSLDFKDYYQKYYKDYEKNSEQINNIEFNNLNDNNEILNKENKLIYCTNNNYLNAQVNNIQDENNKKNILMYDYNTYRNLKGEYRTAEDNNNYKKYKNYFINENVNNINENNIGINGVSNIKMNNNQKNINNRNLENNELNLNHNHNEIKKYPIFPLNFKFLSTNPSDYEIKNTPNCSDLNYQILKNDLKEQEINHKNYNNNFMIISNNTSKSSIFKKKNNLSFSSSRGNYFNQIQKSSNLNILNENEKNNQTTSKIEMYNTNLFKIIKPTEFIISNKSNTPKKEIKSKKNLPKNMSYHEIQSITLKIPKNKKLLLNKGILLETPTYKDRINYSTRISNSNNKSMKDDCFVKNIRDEIKIKNYKLSDDEKMPYYDNINYHIPIKKDYYCESSNLTNNIDELLNCNFCKKYEEISKAGPNKIQNSYHDKKLKNINFKNHKSFAKKRNIK